MDKRLLNILCCPACGGDLKHENSELVCSTCYLAYPIIDDIPVMLIDRARRHHS